MTGDMIKNVKMVIFKKCQILHCVSEKLWFSMSGQLSIDRYGSRNSCIEREECDRIGQYGHILSQSDRIGQYGHIVKI